MSPSDTMREYAAAKTLALLDDLISAMKHSVAAPDEEAVHKVRVAIRRFQQALRLFQQYLKPNGVAGAKAKLHAIMQVAGELRNRDIAIALTKDAGGNTIVLADQRAQFDEQFTALIRPLTYAGVEHKWRRQLGLDIA